MAINEYGARAQEHWKRWLPSRYAALQEPATFFAKMGEEVEARVSALSQALEGEDKPGESYLDKLGRLNMAKLVAQEQAMKEIALLDPESSEDEESAES